MATPSEILGLFTSPQQYQQQQQDLARQRAMEYAKLDPFQKASTAIGQGAYGLAGAIGGALGGTDPQLDMISRRNALLGQLDQSDPESFMKVAQAAAQMGDSQFALAIAQEGRKAKTEMARATQLGAEKMTKEQLNAMAYASQFGTPDSIEYKEAYQQRFDDLTLRAGKETKPFEFEAREAKLQSLKAALRVQQNQPTPNLEAIQRLNDSIQAIEGVDKQDIPKIGVSEATGEAVYYDRNQDLQFVKRKDPKDPTKQIRVPFEGRIDQTTAKVSASASSVGETEFSKDLGKADAERVKNAMTLRDNSISALTTLQGLSKLDEKGLISGSFATGRVGAANILATVGLISEKDAGVLANSQNYQKISGDLVLATLGGKLGSGFSNEDRKFILGLVPQLETNAQARKQLIDFMVKKNNDIVTETTRLEDYARDKKSLKGFSPKIPIFNVGGAVNKPVSQMTREELLNEKARLQSK